MTDMEHFRSLGGQLVQGVILCGGGSRRMGRDKGLLPVNDIPLAARAAMALAPQVANVALNITPEQTAHYAELGWPLCPDTVPGQLGPLAGMAAGFNEAHPWLATLPCDSPAPPADLVARLLEACARAGATLAVARCDGRLHPVFALLHRHWQPELLDALAAGERRVAGWMRAMGALEVDFPEPAAFANINTPEELERWSPGTAKCR